MPDKIETPRLVLRRMTLADAPALHDFMCDAETMRYWSSLPHATLAETEAFVGDTLGAVAAGTSDDFLITHGGAILGKAGLWHGSELGILLGRPYWGQGFAQEASKAVVERAFARGKTEIVADVDPRNTASLKMLGRLGFQKTGEAKATFRIGEAWVDSVYLSLTKDQYDSANHPIR
ncbi:GNAT family N-acetyltransferase [Acidisoma cellulosilytica]|uniref:GNAT family N-acetyltransferase n=1 Tax=Acidisoma cellulosilyticum TaxID=2802395 RepID=A0A963YZG4_9PROT|nr:GNAT family N-acetyltransferase [Acidisoma cellulosilyticum]MCB8879023.1 GNAT family N-acetyltransferase [Acidisoma cellulosilyticum]